MIYYISIALAVLPAILLVLYFNKKDSLKKEPIGMIWFAFVLGILSVIPALILALSLTFLEDTKNVWILVFVQSFITASFVEEISKFGVFKLFIYKNKNFDEVTDGIIYMAIISLGFACLENILYSSGEIVTGLTRAITAVPGHAIWSGIMGYYFGLAKFSENSGFLFIKGLTIGIIYHGLYDFFLFVGTNKDLTDEYFYFCLFIIPILIIGIIHIHKLLKKAKEIDKKRMSGFID